jgi:hypothetical protein
MAAFEQAASDETHWGEQRDLHLRLRPHLHCSLISVSDRAYIAAFRLQGYVRDGHACSAGHTVGGTTAQRRTLTGAGRLRREALTPLLSMLKSC